MKQIVVIGLNILCLGAASLRAAEAGDFIALYRTAPADLPPKAAGLVKAAKTPERETATIQAVTASLQVNPAAAPAVVGAISKAVPEAAASAAGTAAGLQPKQAAAIAKAAVAAAPAMVAKIVEAVCRAVPGEFRAIALAVAEAVPKSAKAIAEGLAAAIPSLKPSLENALETYHGSPPSVAALLDSQAAAARSAASSPPAPSLPSPGLSGGVRGPALGPPYIPLSGTPNNLNPGNSGNVPPGGRDYARP